MHELRRISQGNAITALTESVLKLLDTFDDKEDIKQVMRVISPHTVQVIADAALPLEYYEICQAAKEVQEEAAATKQPAGK